MLSTSRVRGSSPVLAASLAVVSLLGCGDEGFDLGQLNLEPVFTLGSQQVGCAEVPVVRELEVTLLDSTGVAPRSGYPIRVPCGPLSVTGPAGGGWVVVNALGLLDGDPDATLFRARREVELPGSVVELQLRPEVAFLTLDWNFGDRGFEPCTTEVASVEVIVSAAGGGNNAFMGNFDCTDRPIAVDQPLALAPHTIQLRATSEGGYPIYAHTAQRVLDRGPNAYTAVLAPLGGQLLVDWQFDLEGQTLTACDDPRVDVGQVVTRVQGLTLANGQLVPDGSEAVVDRVDCASPRPAAFRPARFVAGRELEIELVAEGVHRFLARQRLTMPSGDALLDVATLVAVGTATAAVDVVTSGCDGVDFTVEVYPATSRTPIRTIDLEPGTFALMVEDLPYGPYRVVVGPTGSAPACAPTSSDRVIDARAVGWGDLPI